MIKTDSLIIKIRRKFIHLFSRFYSDRKYLEKLFPLNVGYKLNLDNPQTYNEKLQWLKLYDRQPEYTQMVDKVEAKRYVANIIGEDHIIPTLAVYEKAEDIDFDALPNQFVLKCTHDSGGIVICPDKSKLDKKEAIKKLQKGLKRNYYNRNREWPYKNVKPRIIAEKYMTNGNDELTDYKVFNFNGVPKLIEIDYNRFKGHLRNLYSTEWEKIDVTIKYPSDSGRTFDRPTVLDELLQLASELSLGIPHVRTDFYIVDDKVLFGELTFFHESGMAPITPDSYNEIMGSWIKLPSSGLGGAIYRHDNAYILIRIVERQAEELRDYKFFCFDGEPKYMFIATDRFNKWEETKFDFYDMDFNHLPFTNGHPNALRQVDKPYNFAKMKDLAAQLSKGIPQVRVDFYDIKGMVYFGELTFYHWSGMVKFEPNDWDYKFGRELFLPITKRD